ncbi:hypothetical protein RKD49_007805 [Streptomyces glaucescens]
MLTATRGDSEGGATRGSQHYGADSENGDRIDDPSEDALFMMISDLNNSDSTASGNIGTAPLALRTVMASQHIG